MQSPEGDTLSITSILLFYTFETVYDEERYALYIGMYCLRTLETHTFEAIKPIHRLKIYT